MYKYKYDIKLYENADYSGYYNVNKGILLLFISAILFFICFFVYIYD